VEGRDLTITVCVGSSCHVRGARDIIQRYGKLIAERKLGDRVQLKGSFCMDRCTEGVNMEIDGEPLSAKTLQEAERIFEEKVLAKLIAES
jgi:NADH:ubiquinone oxidoreductase subunit E